MFARQKNWISGGLWKPKNPHSLEHLKYLHNVLCKNQTVTEHNKGLLVETLRSISEILIWGDQNDSSVFDFFLEKNMLVFFLRFMRQKSGRHICVQLLQTLNILFENISNETSVYYLFSNNHINSIIVHKFDFSDEEVMAYYISFLKTLSLKLNKHTIHFFYNEHTNDFALYTEAIKFFNHPETMVRIAVRTITLNVYKVISCRYTSKLDPSGQPLVDEKSMLRYIRDKTAAPYFSNLVWYIGVHVLELDTCVRQDIDHSSKGRLSDLVAEHLDHLHYLNDILCLNINALNEVLTDHLLNRLLIPLYVYSLTKRNKYAPRSDARPHVNSVVSLFLLSQVFLIMHHPPLVMQLADIILNGDLSVCDEETDSTNSGQSHLRGFIKPLAPLAETLDKVLRSGRKSKSKKHNRPEQSGEGSSARSDGTESEVTTDDGQSQDTSRSSPEVGYESAESSASGAEKQSDEATAPEETSVDAELLSPNQNSTDEEKLLQHLGGPPEVEFSLTNRPYLAAVFSALDCIDNDYESLFALCLLYAMGHNNGINQELLDRILMPTQKSLTKEHYNVILVEKIINILSNSCKNGSRVRLATLELSILLLKTMVYKESQCFLQDRHLAALEGAREEATLQLRNFYKSEEIFLDMFEDEFREMQNRPLNVEYLTMDASILLPPTGTPLTGIEFNKRLPCGEVERARRAIRVFFHLRDLSLTLRQEPESQLPLTRVEECVSTGDVLDLNNSDLIACTVINKESRKERRFLVIDILQLILVEPDVKRLGWGVVKFVGFLQDVEVTGDKEDSRSLHITIHKPATNMHARPIPLLSARFMFDDHIRCMAAKQRLTKGRLRARQRKMQMIARLLELPSHIVESMYQPSSGSSLAAASLRTSSSTGAIPGRSHPVPQKSTTSDTHPPLHRANSDGMQRSPGHSTARDKNTSNPRQLPRHLLAARQTTRMAGGASRLRPVQGSVQRVMEEAGIEVHGAVASDMGLTEGVDEAVEATPSPEAHARQSLNPTVAIASTLDTRGGHSRSSSTDSNNSHILQDIPMEELTKRGSSGHRESSPRAISRRRQSSPLPDCDKTRSGSASPQRGQRSSGSSSPHSRSKLTSDVPQQNKVVSATPAKHSSKTEIKTVHDPEEVTSFIKDSRTKKSASSSHDKKVKKLLSRSRRGSGTSSCPKSLTPAQEPAVSLVPSADHSEQVSDERDLIGSPKLLPPATHLDRNRTFSDTSSSTVESEANTSGVTPLEGDDSSTVEQISQVDSSRLPFHLLPSQAEPLVSESVATADIHKQIEVSSGTDTKAKLMSTVGDTAEETASRDGINES